MLYRPEDISFSPIFHEGEEMKLSQSAIAAEDLECYGGLFVGDSAKFLDSSINTIRVQPTMQWWFEYDMVGFVPDDAALREILDLYSRNSKCNIYKRQRFDQVPALYNPVRYSLVHALSQDFNRRIFTRHPITGVVTEHRFPYTTLPEFRLTAHPCIAHLHAEYVMRRCRHLSSPAALELEQLLRDCPIDWRDLPRSPCPSLTSETSSSSSSSDSLPKIHCPPPRTACKHPRPINTSDINTRPGKYPCGAAKNAPRETTRTVDESRPAKKLRLSPRFTRKPLRIMMQRPSAQRPAWR
ncbi:hypothetical protein CYLTODRAFT_492950 [Cylindrobasidium torrendii FP15055 ss-10]|uniref:Uncharacterized protein n=1 Tax=Cylindrobasidium torrendii FP15055 ss-10 TaxID=1314674 RepID=A0A0D7B351_9AGAR|nr:hypothetical protein CYLTODRAFT_492950 [Cylindrobasidium torrendii FP15055 ss-10]